MNLVNKSLFSVDSVFEECYPMLENGNSLVESIFIDLQQIHPTRRPGVHFLCTDKLSKVKVENYFTNVSGVCGNLRTCAR